MKNFILPLHYWIFTFEEQAAFIEKQAHVNQRDLAYLKAIAKRIDDHAIVPQLNFWISKSHRPLDYLFVMLERSDCEEVHKTILMTVISMIRKGGVFENSNVFSRWRTVKLSRLLKRSFEVLRDVFVYYNDEESDPEKVLISEINDSVSRVMSFTKMYDNRFQELLLRFEVLNSLIPSVNLNVICKVQGSALHIAINLLNRLLGHSSCQKTILLINACQRFIEKLIADGIDINLVDNDGKKAFELDRDPIAIDWLKGCIERHRMKVHNNLSQALDRKLIPPLIGLVSDYTIMPVEPLVFSSAGDGAKVPTKRFQQLKLN